MEIKAGGLVTSGTAYLWNGSVTVSGSTSTWTSTGNLYVGYYYGNNGSFTLTDGGLVNVNAGAGTVYVGDNSTSASGTINFGAAVNAAAAASGTLNAAEVNVPSGRGVGTLQFNTTGSSGAPAYFTRDGTATGAGVATSGKLSLINTAGYTVLTGTLAHTGATTINGGTLQIGNGRTTGSIAGDIAVNGLGGLVFNRADTINYGGTISGSGSGGVTQVGSGTLVLSGANTFTGGVSIGGGGVLSVNSIPNGGIAGPLGAASSYRNNLIFFDGTLRYTGPAASTDRLFALERSGTIDASGTGAINFSNQGAIGFNGTAGTRTLTLTGTNIDHNTVAGALGDNGGTTSLAKTGLGTWVISGNNSYTGPTAVDNGKLRVTGSIASSALTSVAAGARLEGTGTIGNLTVLQDGTLTPGLSGMDAAAGILHTGDTTLFGGSHLEWNIADAATGDGWGSLDIHGSLTFDASAVTDPITIDLFSLAHGVVGHAANFDPEQNYTFLLATASEGIFGGDPDYFSLDASSFTNPAPGTWSVVFEANRLNLLYTAATVPVPEPSACALLAGLLTLGLALHHRQKSARPSRLRPDVRSTPRRLSSVLPVRDRLRPPTGCFAP